VDRKGRRGERTNEEVSVAGLNRQHRLLNRPTRDVLAPEVRRASEVPSIARIRSGHRVRRVEELLGEVGDGELRVGRVGDGGERGVGGGEEMETGEGDEVGGELAEVAGGGTGE
jgi:hypothetical protein